MDSLKSMEVFLQICFDITKSVSYFFRLTWDNGIRICWVELKLKPELSLAMKFFARSGVLSKHGKL